MDVTASYGRAESSRRQAGRIARLDLEGVKMGNSSDKIENNNGYTDNRTALSDLIHDFFCTNPDDMRHKQLAERVKFLKESQQGLMKLSSIIEEIVNNAKKETLLENIRSLMETLNFTAQQAMDALQVPSDKQAELLTLI